MKKNNGKKTASQPSQSNFPPVVAVLGHVDHGKTTLLDAIRKTSIATREHGGITQRIGASSVVTQHDGVKREITFIDTPGHEAFYAMRSRGAVASDIGLLIVSASDGVMPQTKESIKLLQDAKIPFIVVITKVDLPEKNIEKVKGQLSKEAVEIEEQGGDTPVIEVSAKTGKNITELLELILLLQDTQKEKPGISKSGKLLGVIIESKLDSKAGPKATVVIKNGTLRVADKVVCEAVLGKVRTIITSDAKQVKEASVGQGVEILGFEKVPNVGAIVQIVGQETVSTPKDAKSEKKAENKEGELPVIICADTVGSLEAIGHSFPEGVTVVAQKTGEITTNDVILAKSTGAIILGFNVKAKPDAVKLAQTERVLVKTYAIIYELLDELKEAAQGNLKLEEEILGAAQVLARFPYEKTFVLGIKVLEGRIARGDKARLVRADSMLGEANITSLRKGKNQASKAEKGEEAGIILSPLLDFTIGDMVISHR